MNSRTRSIVTTVTLLLLYYSMVAAQQPAKIPRIVWLTAGSPSIIAPRVEAFRQGMRELGYVEGKNILIELRGAENRPDRMKPLAEEVVHLKADIIVTSGEAVTRAVKEITSTIPIVMASDDDPVGSGFAASLARPGGNITGLSQLSPELNGKRLEILKEMLPKLATLAVFGSAGTVGQAREIKEIEQAAAALSVKLRYFDVLASKDIEPAFQGAVKGRADAVLENIAGHIRSSRLKELADLAIKHRLPVMRERPEHVQAGGLVCYGVSLPALARRAAVYADKILKGAKPADLPVERPTKFELVINLNAAKQIGLTIPPNVLARADRVIR